MSNNPPPYNDNERYFGCDKPRTKYVPDPYFYDFCNTYLPSSKNYWITDIDICIRDRNNNMMFIEMKYYMAEPTKVQSNTFHIFHALFKKADGCGRLELPYLNVENWQYYGFHLLQFEGTTFENGKVFFDRKEVTQDEFIKLMSFESENIKIIARN